MTVSVDEHRTVDFIYFDLSKAIDIVSYVRIHIQTFQSQWVD